MKNISKEKIVSALEKQLSLASEPNITIDDEGRVECDCDPMPGTNERGRVFAGYIKDIIFNS